MKLAAKIALFIWIGIILVISIDAYLSLRRDLETFRGDMIRDARQYGRIVQGVTASLWQERGGTEAFNFLREAARESHPMRIRLVLPNAPPGDPRAPLVGNLGPRALRPGAEVVVEAPQVGDEGLLVTYRPIVVNEEIKALLEIAEPMTELREYANSALWRAAALLAGSLAASGVLILIAGLHLVGRPLQKLMDKTRRIGSGDFGTPLKLKGRGELNTLANALNQMCDQLALSHRQIQEESEARVAALEQLRHAERLATVGRLAAGMAHELGTPLNVVSGRAQMIASGDLSPTDAARNATIISEQASRMTTLMRQLLDFARRGSTRREPTSLEHLVRGVLDLLTSSAGKKDVTVEMHADPELPQVAVDPAKMQQVVTNLVLNGIQATHRGGKVDVELSYLKAGDSNGMQNDMATIVVQDTGPGIPPEHLDQLFEPFFTTKDVGEGTGLGLSIVYGIVEEHGGWIEVASPPGAGARFTLFLPLEATQ